MQAGSRYFPYDSRYWSKKVNRAALRYEIAVCIRTGDIVWINGPYPAGCCNDLTIFYDKLVHKIPDGEMVEADKGYPHPKVRTADNFVSFADKKAKGKARNRHEHVNGLYKDFGILRQLYRHDRKRHMKNMGAITTILQVSFDEGQEPWQVKY